ncbi:transposase [Novosphingobium sp. BL-52-GroH]|uniref:transposase n=1 Tax=Novosphingobium sp. BL-52-GroH TaxID=3349877 RepID=UPI00384B12D1
MFHGSSSCDEDRLGPSEEPSDAQCRASHSRRADGHTVLRFRRRLRFSCKVHARCDNQGRLLGFILAGGEATDYGAVDALMAIPVTKPKALLADKGYDGDAVRENLLMQGILPIIPLKPKRREPIPCGFAAIGIETASSACSAT